MCRPPLRLSPLKMFLAWQSQVPRIGRMNNVKYTRAANQSRMPHVFGAPITPGAVNRREKAGCGLRAVQST